MADEEVELDYEELEEKVESEQAEKKALPERYKRQNVEPRPKNLEEKDRIPEGVGSALPEFMFATKSSSTRPDILSSGRISDVSRRPVKSDDRTIYYDKYSDYYEPEKEEKQPDSDDETGFFFQKVLYTNKQKVDFPKFPIDRKGVKEDLGVTNNHLRFAIVVHGIEDLNEYAILKTFSEYGACRLDLIDSKSCIVEFEKEKSALKMMTEMSLSLTTNDARFAGHLKMYQLDQGLDDKKEPDDEPEDGEVSSDDEGEIMETGVTNSRYRIATGTDIRKSEHVVYINTRKYFIPEEKWRVVTRHVPMNRALLVRFATYSERKKAKNDATAVILPGKNVDRNGLEYSWQGQKVRAGLNIFDNEGKELEWDFEHDTRFFEEKKEMKEPVEEKEWERPALQVGIKGAVKVRGRGAKRFLGDDSDTLNSDRDEATSRKTQRRDSDDDDWHIPPSETPTRSGW